MLHTTTRVYIVRRENKTSTGRTAINIDTSLKNIYAGIIMRNNECTATRRLNKSCSWKNRKATKKNKRKRKMWLKIYSMTSYSLDMTHSCAKIKQTTEKKSKYSFLNQYLHHIRSKVLRTLTTWYNYKHHQKQETRDWWQACFNNTGRNTRK